MRLTIFACAFASALAFNTADSFRAVHALTKRQDAGACASSCDPFTNAAQACTTTNSEIEALAACVCGPAVLGPKDACISCVASSGSLSDTDKAFLNDAAQRADLLEFITEASHTRTEIEQGCAALGSASPGSSGAPITSAGGASSTPSATGSAPSLASGGGSTRPAPLIPSGGGVAPSATDRGGSIPTASASGTPAAGTGAAPGLAVAKSSVALLAVVAGLAFLA